MHRGTCRAVCPFSKSHLHTDYRGNLGLVVIVFFFFAINGKLDSESLKRIYKYIQLYTDIYIYTFQMALSPFLYIHNQLCLFCQYIRVLCRNCHFTKGGSWGNCQFIIYNGTCLKSGGTQVPGSITKGDTIYIYMCEYI